MKKRRRFTPEFTAQVVLEVLTGVQSPAEACRKHALSPNLLTTWKTTVPERAHTLFQGDEQHDEDQARIAELEELLGRATRQIADFRGTVQTRRSSPSTRIRCGIASQVFPASREVTPGPLPFRCSEPPSEYNVNVYI